jgi:hypothetical protein
MRARDTISRQTALVPSALPSLTRTISCPPGTASCSMSWTTAPIVSAELYSGMTNESAGVRVDTSS